MSVTLQTPFKDFTATPGATLFSTDFRVILASDLVVRKDGVVQTSGFTISGLGNPSGVDVTFGVPMVGGEKIELQRSVPLVRATDYQQTGDFLSPVVNTDFDRLWMALQDSQFLSNLAILLPVGDPLAPMSIPDVATRASKFLAFDALGQAIAASASSGVPVTAFIATLLDDADAAAARTTLELGSVAVENVVPIAKGGTGQSTAALAFAAIKQAATTSATGVVELATNAEAQAGTDTSRAITAANLKAAQIQLGTAVASTSGTAIDFTGIPSYAKRVTVHLAGVSFTDASGVLIQLGDSGGVETTGYVSGTTTVANNVVGSLTTTTAGVIASSGAAAQSIHGAVTFDLVDAATNTWVASGTTFLSATGQHIVAGSKALSAVLDRVRVATIGGSGGSFDAGLINVSWE